MYDGIENTTLNSVHIANVISEKMRTEQNMSLTLTQKKLIFYLISQIQETDIDLKRTSISFSDFFRLTETDYSGGYKERLEKQLINFCSKCFWLPHPIKNMKIVCRWLDECVIDYDNGIIHLKLSETLKPYFLELSKKARTIFQLGYVLQFKYRYTPDIYLFVSRCKNLNAPYLLPINEAYQRFGEGKYNNLYDLKRRVLNPSIQEINEKSELTVQVDYIKSKRKTTHICFIVRKKTGQALLEASEWKERVKKKTVSDKAKELFNEAILEEATVCDYVDCSDPDSISTFDEEEFLDSRKHLTKEEYSNSKKYTAEEIEEACSVDFIEFMESEYPDRIRYFRSEYRDTEHDSLVFYKDHYHRFSNEDHGNAINYLQKYIGLTFIESVDKLLNFGLLHISQYNIPMEPEKPVKTIYRPIKNKNIENIYDYLESRYIDTSTLQLELGKNKMYSASVKNEGDNYICFANDEMKFYILKNTESTGTKNMIISENPGGYWWFVPFGENLEEYDSIFNVYVCESPIDAISLYRLESVPAVYCSMGGLKDISLKQICERFSDQKHYKIVLAVDNDKSGNDFCKKHSEFERIVPDFKDWNEDLYFKK